MATEDNVSARQPIVVERKPAQQDSVSFLDIWSISVSHWYWYAISVVLCLILAVFYLLCTPKLYTRQASVMIKEDHKSRALSSQFGSLGADLDLQSSSSVDNELIAIQSPSVLLEVIKRMHLDYTYKTPGIFQNPTLYGRTLPIQVEILGLNDMQSASFSITINGGKASLTDFYTVVEEEKIDDESVVTCNIGDTVQTPIGQIVVSGTAYPVSEEMTILVSRTNLYKKLDNVSSTLQAALSDKRSSVINLTYTDVNIQRAEDIINTLITVYNESWVKDKNQVAVSTSEFINDRLKVIESELGNVDNDISKFKSSNMLPDVAQVSHMAMSEAQVSSASVRSLNNRMYMARYVKNYIQREDASFQLLPVNSGIESSAIESQISSYNEMVLRRNSLVSNSSENNPLVIDLNIKLQDLRNNIVVGLDNLITSLNEQIRSEQLNVDRTTNRIAQSPLQARDLLSVERQQKVKESLYLFLLQKREENELNQAFSAYNTRIITPPMGSMYPTSPVRNRILLIALFLGLGIPFAFIYVTEMLNTRVRGRKDLERLTAPFVGEIPMYRSRRKPSKDDPEYRILVKPRSRNIINEAFRVVRTNLEFIVNAAQNDARVFIITSLNPGSGKTFLLSNIAASFAIKEKKVVVVDLDFRRCSTSELVNKPSVGLSEYLTGQVAECPTYKMEEFTNIDFIPVGTMPPNPTELVSTAKLQQFIQKLRTQYDYVFLDCPPVDIVADTSIISKWADVTLFIIRAGLMEREMLSHVESFYQEKRFTNMAIILNGTTSRHGRYGYGYGYGYGGYGGYGYGYGSKHKKRDYYTHDDDE